MNAATQYAVYVRAGWRCAWCACRLGSNAAAPVVCTLGLSDAHDLLVASCRACCGEFVRWWRFHLDYPVDTAKRILGRHGATTSGPFVDYLERVTNGRGYLTPFVTALARIEAQRHAPLDLVAAKAALNRRAA